MGDTKGLDVGIGGWDGHPNSAIYRREARRSWCAMPLRGALARSRSFVAASLARSRPRFSVGIPLEEFSHVVRHVPLGE